MSDPDTIKILLDALTRTLSDMSKSIDQLSASSERHEKQWSEVSVNVSKVLEVVQDLRNELAGDGKGDGGMRADIKAVRDELGPISQVSAMLRTPMGAVAGLLLLGVTIWGIKEVFDKVHDTWFSASAPSSTVPSVPLYPTYLSATQVKSDEVTITWYAQDKLTKWYQVYRDGAYVATVDGTSYTDHHLAPHTTYCYTVIAYDTAGTASVPSARCFVQTENKEK